jgi:hypothetical protein
MQQATSDLGEYNDLAPGNLRYSPRRRRYVADEGFKRAFRTTNVRNFLRRLIRAAERPSVQSLGWVGPILDVKTVSPPRRNPPAAILKAVLQAIRDNAVLEVDYVSMSSGRTEGRRVVPHAFGYDGFRWHVRVFDYKRDDYIDLVMSRITRASRLLPLEDALPDDWRWSKSYTFRLRPDQTLSSEKQRAIAHEFGMTDVADPDGGGPDNPRDYSLDVITTHAMLFYILRLYGFDPRRIKTSGDRSVSQFSLELFDQAGVREALH